MLLNGVAASAYIGAGLGPGPREGLMKGWAARGHQISLDVDRADLFAGVANEASAELHYEEDADARLRS